MLFLQRANYNFPFSSSIHKKNYFYVYIYVNLEAPILDVATRGLSIKTIAKIPIDDVVKQHGIMGFVILITIANEKLPDATRAQIMFGDDETY